MGSGWRGARYALPGRFEPKVQLARYACSAAPGGACLSGGASGKPGIAGEALAPRIAAPRSLKPAVRRHVMPAATRQMPDEGLELVKSFEGIPDGDPTTGNLDAYLDPLGIWTIGWGHALPASGGGWLRGPENKATARAAYPGGLTV